MFYLFSSMYSEHYFFSSSVFTRFLLEVFKAIFFSKFTLVCCYRLLISSTFTYCVFNNFTIVNLISFTFVVMVTLQLGLDCGLIIPMVVDYSIDDIYFWVQGHCSHSNETYYLLFHVLSVVNISCLYYN